jgi:hypothetical protein
MFDFYRVKEVEGKFIPQKLSEMSWAGIESQFDCMWHSPDFQIKYCSVNSLEEAKDIIAKYKEKIKKAKAKYYYNV